MIYPRVRGESLTWEGPSFTGIIKNWHPVEGYGTIIGVNYHYTGYLKNGEATGYGKITYIEKGKSSVSGYADGDTYTGQFLKNRKHGKGIMKFANGDEYSGMFADNNFNGQGTLKFATGEKYTGEWKNSRCHGRGTLVFTDGQMYSG